MEILGLRHRPSDAHAGLAGTGPSFAEYVQRAQAMLRQAHEGKNEQERIVAGNSPFELHPVGAYAGGRRRGVLLIHGLTDSPYYMRYVATFFQRMGFRVMAALLPGHGTQPGDLLHVRWRDWAATVAWGADCMANEVDELYLGGYSAGAALCLLQAERDRRVRGLFLFSPALAITALAKWANLHRLYSWLLPRTAWVDVLQDRDLYKYESFCKNAAAQMYALTQALPRAVDIPVFAAASADDATVDATATLRFMQRESPAPRHLVWYATDEQDPLSPESEAGVREVSTTGHIEWVNSAMPEKRIVSSAHTAILIPPRDEHYGENGSYRNCLHYQAQNRENDAACRSRTVLPYQGEVTAQNLQRGLLQRLMYNPHYEEMETSMQEFIERLP